MDPTSEAGAPMIDPTETPDQVGKNALADRVDSLPQVLQETVLTAAGQRHRADPELPGSGGPAGNALLTAWTGLVLLVLFVAELLTLFDVNGLISWHLAIGLLLVPPALLKTATTSYRVLRYYTGSPVYTEAGPPPTLLRLLGPAVVAGTWLLLGSGVLLVLLGSDRSRSVIVDVLGQRVDWVSLHQVSFIAWAVVTGLHVLSRTVPAVLTVQRRPSRLDGRVLRVGALAAAAVASVVAAVLVVQLATSWVGGRDARRGGLRPGVVGER